MRRPLVDGLAVADLDDLAEVHDSHSVRDVTHDREVVCDEEERDTEFVLQILQQVDHAGLNRHVERRDGLVENEQLGLQDEGPGDTDALALAARELVRVTVRVVGLEPHE